MSSTAVPTARPVLADLVPGALARDAALVVAGALLTAVAAQFEIMLGFTPVPISGQTFAVLLAGAALGPGRGALSQGLYVLLGAVGLPFYSGGEAGWTHLWGATGGYLVGFAVAAGLVGMLAQRGFDRGPLRTVVAMTLGNAAIYLFGVPWLAVVADLSASEAIANGMLPFVPGDAVKMALAAGLLPGAWWIVRRVRNGDDGAASDDDGISGAAT